MIQQQDKLKKPIPMQKDRIVINVVFVVVLLCFIGATISISIDKELSPAVSLFFGSIILLSVVYAAGRVFMGIVSSYGSYDHTRIHDELENSQIHRDNIIIKELGMTADAFDAILGWHPDACDYVHVAGILATYRELNANIMSTEAYTTMYADDAGDGADTNEKATEDDKTKEAVRELSDAIKNDETDHKDIAAKLKKLNERISTTKSKLIADFMDIRKETATTKTAMSKSKPTTSAASKDTGEVLKESHDKYIVELGKSIKTTLDNLDEVATKLPDTVPQAAATRAFNIAVSDVTSTFAKTTKEIDTTFTKHIETYKKTSTDLIKKLKIPIKSVDDHTKKIDEILTEINNISDRINPSTTPDAATISKKWAEYKKIIDGYKTEIKTLKSRINVKQHRVRILYANPYDKKITDVRYLQDISKDNTTRSVFVLFMEAPYAHFNTTTIDRIASSDAPVCKAALSTIYATLHRRYKQNTESRVENKDRRAFICNNVAVTSGYAPNKQTVPRYTMAHKKITQVFVEPGYDSEAKLNAIIDKVFNTTIDNIYIIPPKTGDMNNVYKWLCAGKYKKITLVYTPRQESETERKNLELLGMHKDHYDDYVRSYNNDEDCTYHIDRLHGVRS
jgi:hypothetical protein